MTARREAAREEREGEAPRRAGAEQPYHHGDLRAALLAAAEAELTERGIEGFTLRGCARRAGVSHAAPAHHFKDVTGLLTALAAIGFERLTATLRQARAEEGGNGEAQYRATARAYVRFALENPQHFRLMFRRARLDPGNEALRIVAPAAFGELLAIVAGLVGHEVSVADAEDAADIHLTWASVHGLAHLALEGQIAAGADRPDAALDLAERMAIRCARGILARRA
jgi:AcrR family transcriptional regulator